MEPEDIGEKMTRIVNFSQAWSLIQEENSQNENTLTTSECEEHEELVRSLSSFVDNEETVETSSESEYDSNSREESVLGTLTYFCEWRDCAEANYDDLTKFLMHIRMHVNNLNVNSEQTSTITCLWSDCMEEFASDQNKEFLLHLTYHGYHTKLMAYGMMEIRRLSKKVERPVQCYMDSSSRTLLPGLPESFVCGWKDCFTSYGDAESFYRHVERHPFDDVNIPSISKEELKKTRFAKCMWNDCTAAFNSRTHLKEHLRSHTQEKRVACPHCGSMFFNRIKFHDHLFRQEFVEDEEDQPLLMPMSPTEKETEPLVVLSGKQSNEQASTSVDATNSSEIHSNSKERIDPRKCTFCDKTLPTSTLLSEHMRSHKTHWKCNLCGYSTNSYSSLTHHIIYRHSELRPFPCQFCEAKFKSRSDLRKHIDIHSDDHPFKCSQCSFKCRCCHTLAAHRKREHESLKIMYQCDICHKNFTRGNNLSRHLVKMHKQSIPSGRARFTYKRSEEDGIFRRIIYQ